MIPRSERCALLGSMVLGAALFAAGIAFARVFWPT